jgi:anthranilate synthase/aminodeoxychorismate synthase-like glutamine amidotransferase
MTSTSTPTSGITLMIDNYDSFTYNIVQYLAQLGADVRVFRNDEITPQEALALNPVNVVISPGPGNPSEAGVSKAIIATFAGKVPVLGVCLGHQAIIEEYGGQVVRCGHIMHGKVSAVWHDGKGVYAGLDGDAASSAPLLPSSYNDTSSFSSSLLATRYHSLIGNASTLPSSLQVTSYVMETQQPPAETAAEKRQHAHEKEEKEERKEEEKVVMARTIMGVRHKRWTVEGVQFHPESVTTQHGMKMLSNFLRLRGGQWKDARLI